MFNICGLIWTVPNIYLTKRFKSFGFEAAYKLTPVRFKFGIFEWMLKSTMVSSMELGPG